MPVQLSLLVKIINIDAGIYSDGAIVRQLLTSLLIRRRLCMRNWLIC